MMPSTRTVSLALKATAVINIVAALGALVAPALHAELMYSPGTEFSGLTLRFHIIIWAFVLAMGVGYAIAARDPERQTALLASAALGKLAVAVLWIEMLASGYGAWLLLAGVCWDGALGALFAVYLWGRAR